METGAWPMKIIKAGLIGFGNIGSGTVKLLMESG